MKNNKLKSYLVFTKFRLAFTVVISAVLGYIFNEGSSWIDGFLVFLGGTLVTAAANGSNQIWERDVDALMNRTNKRPLVTGEMTVKEAYIVVIFSLIVGTILLGMINMLSAILGVISYISYVFIYTPMKLKTPWAVFVGAFPGALPPMIGAVAASGHFGLVPGVLFFVQFVWQFPHFWSIAWITFDDYKKGGFSLLPSQFGKSKNSAFQIVLYSAFLIPFSLIPWLLGWTNNVSLVLVSILGLLFYLQADRLLRTCEDKEAKRLMFASIIYLPLIQIIYCLTRTDLPLSDVVFVGL